MGDLPLPTPAPSNEPSPRSPNSTESSASDNGSSNAINPSTSSSAPSMDSCFADIQTFIPAHSSDLGRLPLHIPLPSITDPTFSYGTTDPVPNSFGPTASSEANPRLDDVLAAFGFGPVSFEAAPMPTEAVPSATSGDEASNWPDFWLDVE